MRNNYIAYVLLYFGIPVCGKGLQGRLLDLVADPAKLRRYVMRDMIAAKKVADPAFKTMAEEYEDAGDLLPCPIINNLVDEAITDPTEVGTILCVDGAGRTLDQMSHLQRRMSSVAPAKIRVAHFRMDTARAEERFLATLGASDRVGRRDARFELHQKRTREHLEREHEILAFCRARGWQVATIDADRPPLDVHKDLRQKLSLGRLEARQITGIKDFLRRQEASVVPFVVPEEVRLEA